MMRARRKSWTVPVVSVGLLAVLAASVSARETVRARAWDHASYGRIVLDWPAAVRFSARIENRRLIVRFGRAFAADFAPVLRDLKAYLKAARTLPDGRGATFDLTGDYALASFARGKSVVLDLSRRDASAVSDRARSAEKAAATSTARKTVAIRVGRHAAFIRMVFDWAEPVQYAVKEDAKSVTIRFDKAARYEIAALRRRLAVFWEGAQVKAGASGKVLVFSKPAGRSVRHLRVGRKVVVDFLKTASAAAKAKPADAKPARAKELPASAPKTAKDTSPLQAPPEETPAGADPTTSDPSSEQAATANAETPAKPEAPEKSGASGPAKQADSAQEESADQSAVAAAPRVGSSSPEPAPSQAAAGDFVSLVFDWPEPVGAAVFVREPYVWIVFDRRAQLNLASLRDAGRGMIKRIEQLPQSEATVVRLQAPAGVMPQVQNEETNWVVTLRRWSIEPQVPIDLRIRPEAIEGAELELPISELGRIFQLPDPEVGDALLVATLQAPGHGIAQRRRYPEFEILESAQGIAIDPLRDDVQLKPSRDRGLVLHVPGGLHVSSVSRGRDGHGSFLGPRVFNFANWIGDKDKSFTDARQDAMRAVVEVPKERRDDARLDLARFFFAHGFASEALGVLKAIEFSNQEMASQPEFRALIGATLVYMGRHAEARRDLLDPRLDAYQEIALWRGSMFLQAGEPKKAAAQFRTGDPALQSYPDPVRTKLVLERIETSLADLDVGSASLWANFLAKSIDALSRHTMARLLYNQGILARDSRNLDRAVELWSKVRKSNDRWNSARAELALVNLGLQQETINRDEAIERLERLRFDWRGDELEMAVLRRLGGLYLEKGEFRKGLNTLRTAVTYFPNSRKVKEIAQLMSAAFRELHLEGGADKLPPLSALALYDDFRELTPVGPEGDLMIQRLADRLVSVDLLGRASDLLAHQVRYRLKGDERARVGAKLAVIRLLDRNPKGALAALRSSFQPNLSQDLEDDRRRIRAKATLELGRYDEAIALLAGDVSREADLLRADIYWSTQNYAEAAKVLQRLSGDPLIDGAYPEEQASFILSWAVALRLKRDEAGISMLRDLYGPGMGQSKLADAFVFISSPTGDAAKNVEEITRRIAERDNFEAFLKNYRERLMAPKERVAGGGAAVGGNDEQGAPADSGTGAARSTDNQDAIPPPPS